ncbi:MAG: glycosyltransferase [Alphaproteobacteria bacterium]
MRLLQTMAGAEMGGAEAFFVRLAAAFARRGLDQHLVIRRDPARARALRRAGITPVELPFGSRMDFRTRPAIAREIERYRPDVVLAWMSRAAWATPQAKAPAAYSLVGRLGGYYDLRYYRHCDRLVANTDDIRDWIVGQGWPAERVHMLPNFVDPPAAEAVSRFGLDTPLEAPLLVAAGRLHENKGFDVLLAALAALPGVWLWLAGEGPEGAALHRQAESLGVAGRVRFLGWRDDVPALMAAADVYVCSSRHEPLGNVVLEAWAAGRPVVAADVAGPGRLIEDGRTGLLVPAEDASALAAAIGALLSDRSRAAAIAAAGRAAWERDYTEAVVVDRWLDFLATLAR